MNDDLTPVLLSPDDLRVIDIALASRARQVEADIAAQEARTDGGPSPVLLDSWRQHVAECRDVLTLVRGYTATDDAPPTPYQDWIDRGIAHGWCSPIVCGTHDGLPYTADEVESIPEDELLDTCVFGVRLYGNRS